jgi:hypothetical protein
MMANPLPFGHRKGKPNSCTLQVSAHPAAAPAVTYLGYLYT